MADYVAEYVASGSYFYASPGTSDSNGGEIWFPTPTPVVGTTYLMRGWYAAGAKFEYWLETDQTAPPPSGHTLLDIQATPLD